MTQKLQLKSPVKMVPFIGDRYEFLLGKLEIFTVKDLLFHFPSRYEDYSKIMNISEIMAGIPLTVRGHFTKLDCVRVRGGKTITKGFFSDDSGKVETVFFNQPYLAKSIKINEEMYLSGIAEGVGAKLAFTNPTLEAVRFGKDSVPLPTINTGKIVAVYPETDGVSSKWIRGRVRAVLPSLLESLQENDVLPDKIRDRFRLYSLREALWKIHFPENENDLSLARERFAFEELLSVRLKSLVRRKQFSERRTGFAVIQKNASDFLETFGFGLTRSQANAINEITSNLIKETPMNRLLQGDVGSGKTVVAATAAFLILKSKRKVIYLAPTTILASQQYKSLEPKYSSFGYKSILVTGNSQKPKDITKDADIIFATQALFYNKKNLKGFGLIIIDEQHKFGVGQRTNLLEHFSKNDFPHLLTMTATPIPRTLALSVFGHLDITEIPDSPPGKKPVTTWVIPEEKRNAGYKWIEKYLVETGGQAFIVCPFIEESENDSLKIVKSAISEFKKLKTEIFPKLKLGLLHGQTPKSEKETLLNSFKERKIDILVTTPIVEVGIDFPNAVIILIEGAERFGLASLHQLRGRVGRAGKKAYCLLFSSAKASKAESRLRLMEKYNTGIKLAEEDLKIRGPGEFFGINQSGFPNLRVAKWGNSSLINKAGGAADWVIAMGLEKYPLLMAELGSGGSLTSLN